MEPSVQYYDNQDKRIIIDYCIDHIKKGNEGGNGYCSLFYAAQQSCPGKTFENTRHKISYLKSVAALITESGEYEISLTYGDGNFDIKRVAGYKEKKYFEKHPTREKIFIAVVSAFLAAIVPISLNIYNKQEQRKADYLQDQQIRELKVVVKKLENSLKFKK